MPYEDLEYIARMVNRLGPELHAAHVRAVEGVAGSASRTINANVRAATGGNSRLSGTTTNARIGISRVKQMGGPNPSIALYPNGPIMLIEEDTRPHEIPRQGNVRRSRKRLRFPDGEIRGGPVSHPGTRGKHPWARAIQTAHYKAGVVYDREVQRAIREAMH